jgi:ankyrin repeat protein
VVEVREDLCCAAGSFILSFLVHSKNNIKLLAMGCGSSNDTQVASAPGTLPPSNKNQNLSPVLVPVAKPEVVKPLAPTTTTFQQVHSSIRWNKPLEDIIPLLNIDGAVHLTDPKTGNFPLHIAAQNGHFEIVVHLIEVCKVDPNVKNNSGNTPLHMAIEYDYLEVATYLVSKGATKDIENIGGKRSGKGIEGCKTIETLTFSTANTEAELLEALNLCDKHIKDLDKTTLVTTGLKKKKAAGSEWTDEVQNNFKLLLEKAI